MNLKGFSRLFVLSTCLVTGVTIGMAVNAEENIIFQCAGAQGEPVFSNSACGVLQQEVKLGETGIIDGAVTRTLQERASAIRALPAEPSRKVPKKETGHIPGRRSFGERVELRRLSIKEDGLVHDLRRALGGNARLSLQRSLEKTRRKIEALERR